MFKKKIVYDKDSDTIVDIIPRYNFWSKRKYKGSKFIVEKDQKVKVLSGSQQSLPMQQWPLDVTNVRLAHKLSTGKGVRIGVFDSGIDYTHLEFQDEAYQKSIVHQDVNQADWWNYGKREYLLREIEIGRNKVIKYGRDYIRKEKDFFDWMRHATGVSSIIAAQGRHLLGVAPDSELYIYRVITSSGIGSLSTVAKALEDAIYDGIDIAFFSLAFPYYSSIMSKIVRQCEQAGIIVVAATGNNNREKKMYPAATPGVIAVGGCNQKMRRWASTNYLGSNWGSHIKFLCPASEQPVCLRINSRYVINQGTSLAAPHFAGICALVLSILRNREYSNNLKGDITKDGEVDIMDLVRIGKTFGDTYRGSDLNKDGVVDIQDLVEVGLNFGEKKSKTNYTSEVFNIIKDSSSNHFLWNKYTGYGVPDARKACEIALSKH